MAFNVLKGCLMVQRQGPVERGQRYRDIGRGTFGASETDWIVDGIFRGTDGILYAHVVSTSDLTQRKTLSAEALCDRRRFRRM